MIKKTINLLIVLTLFLITPLASTAKPVACEGVSKQCTENDRFDKTIEGQNYSCYKCKQTVCKSGGSGPIAGTETTTVCESKDSSNRSRIQSSQTTQFDEADSVFGKRTKIKVPKSGEGNTGVIYKKSKRTGTVDHRKTNSNKTNLKISNSTDYRKKSRIKNTSSNSLLAAPTQVTLYDVKNNQLNISWIDNAKNEYGVSIERGIPKQERGGINYHWRHVFNVQERIDSNVKGTGWRSDSDDGLASDTEYCYRLRAYYKNKYSDYSTTACALSK